MAQCMFAAEAGWTVRGHAKRRRSREERGRSRCLLEWILETEWMGEAPGGPKRVGKASCEGGQPFDLLTARRTKEGRRHLKSGSSLVRTWERGGGWSCCNAALLWQRRPGPYHSHFAISHVTRHASLDYILRNASYIGSLRITITAPGVTGINCFQPP